MRVKTETLPVSGTLVPYSFKKIVVERHQIIIKQNGGFILMKKYSSIDKIMFPILNVVVVAVVFVLLKVLFEPSTALEYTAIILMCGIVATPIANAHRKEIREHNQVATMKEANQPLRKSA